VAVAPIIKELTKVLAKNVSKPSGKGGLSSLGEPTKSPLRKIFDESPASKLEEIPPQIDETGLTGYHGTIRGERVGEDFFDISQSHPLDQFLGEGHYFTVNPKVAERYANIRASEKVGFEPLLRGKGDTRYRSKDLDTYTTTGNLLKGIDEKGEPFSAGQTVARFDMGGLTKPYIVKNNKDRLYVKDNIDKIKEEGYDSIVFKDFGDNSQQILVFPEHIKKVKSREEGLSSLVNKVEKKLPPKEAKFFEDMLAKGDAWDLKADVPSVKIKVNKEGDKYLSVDLEDMNKFYKWSESFPDIKDLPNSIKSGEWWNRFKDKEGLNIWDKGLKSLGEK
tara:strand:- start:145 stop:1146 length:1002 start_codon:yes stop_codon:yes gene_type:complete